MDRPKTLHVGGTVYWVLRLYDPTDGITLVDADSTPTVAVRKNGASTADSVTVTKRSATTGIYDCSYNPASEVEGDKFTLEESATISSNPYTANWELVVIALERGTDGANTTTPPTVGAIGDEIETRELILTAAYEAAKDAASSADLATVDALVDTLIARLTATRAGYLDNLAAGPVATSAEVLAINQSASRRILLATVPAYERPESGAVEYTIECRTYTADGAAVNADATPTLSATGETSGSLAANLSAGSNPETGVYRWKYSVSSAATTEPVRFSVSATIASETFTLSAFTQVADFVSATWNTTDRSKLTAVFDKLPGKTYLAGSDNTSGDVELDDATGALAAARFAAGSLNGKGDWAVAGDAMDLVAAWDDLLTAAVRFLTMVEDGGAGDYVYTVEALANAPAGGGGGGGTDWTANERTAIRSILGIPGSGTTPADPSVGIMDTIRDLLVSNSPRVVYVENAVRQNDAVEIVAGDAYAANWINEPLHWEIASGTDISGVGYSATLTVRDADGAVVLAAEGAISSAGGGVYDVDVSLTAADTDLAAADYTFDLEIAGPSLVATPVTGRLVVVAQVTTP